MRFLFVALMHLITMGSAAQINNVAGTVLDSAGLPLANVSVTLELRSESRSTKTNQVGSYIFDKVSAEKFLIRFSFIGYENYTLNYSSDFITDKKILIDTIRLKLNITVLPEVVLTPTNPVTIKEDTVEYKADAYKVRDGAMAEDILKKLPGIMVNRDGGISAQGKEVTRVRVNGKDYFDGDVLTATRNLPAGAVDNIQVIDDYGEKGKLTGIKEGEAEKILNINLKKDKSHGTFGNATLVAGTKGRYLANASANNFNEDKQISLLASLNNTNVGAFDFNGGTRGAARNASSLGNVNGGGNGVTQQSSVGINYRNAWGRKLTSYGSYSYATRRNMTQGESFLQDVNEQNINAIKSSYESVAKSNNYRIAWNLEYKMDSLNYVKISPFLSSASSHNTYNGNSAYTRPKYATLSNGRQDNSDEAPSWGTEIFYIHKFKTQSRNVSVSATLNQANRDQERDVRNSYHNIDSTFTTPLSSYTQQNQLIGNDNVNTTSNLRLSYVEPWKKKTTLELSYAWNRSHTQSLRDVNDVDQMTGEKVKNLSQSNDYNYTFITHRIGLNLYRNEKKYNYSAGITGQPSLLTGSDDRRNSMTRNANFNFIPTARFVYKLSSNQSLTASYGGSSREPGFTQLQPVSDSSNLKTIIKGNPNLRPEFTNRFRLQYNQAGLLTGRVLFANISFDKTQNKIVSSRFNDATGTGRTISYLNTNGFYGLHGHISVTQPFAKKRFAISFTTSGSFDNNISYTDFQKNTGNNWTLRPELLLRIDIPDKIDINIGGGYTYNKNTTRYTMYSHTSNVQLLNVGINGKNYFLKDWTLGYDLTKHMYIGYLKSFNTNPTLLNVFVERRFLKNNKGSFRAQAFDLFDQNAGISRNINGTTITDLQNNRLSRYFLVSFNYKLQKFGGK